MIRIEAAALCALIAAALMVCAACAPTGDDHAGDTGIAACDPVATALSPLVVYRYLRIEDLSGGAAIDAVVVTKPHGGEYHASTVQAYAPGTALDPAQNEPAAALGPPDVFAAWPERTPCDETGGRVALAGGSLTVGLDIDLEPGDTLTTLDTRSCTANDEGTLRLSISAFADRGWIELGTVDAANATFLVHCLPPVDD